MNWGAQGRRTRRKPASGSIPCPTLSVGPSAKSQVKARSR